MSEFVCPNTFCTFGPKLRMINQVGGGGGGGEGGKSLYFWSISFKNFDSRAIRATRKSYCGISASA